MPDATLADLQAALLTSLNDFTGTGSGGVDWSFAIQDSDLDFLSAGETLTMTYDVTVSDGITTSTQQVTITATGAEDPLTVNPATGVALGYRRHGHRQFHRLRQCHHRCRDSGAIKASRSASPT